MVGPVSEAATLPPDVGRVRSVLCVLLGVVAAGGAGLGALGGSAGVRTALTQSTGLDLTSLVLVLGSMELLLGTTALGLFVDLHRRARSSSAASVRVLAGRGVPPP